MMHLVFGQLLVISFSQELPEQWNNVKKVSIAMKQTVAPLQANEVNIIRRKLATFDVRYSHILLKKIIIIYNVGKAT